MPRIELEGHDLVGLRAENPGPLTLSGTNSWLLGRHPTWVVDPGPALPGHLEALAREIESRGGLGGIALTHDHADHCEAVAPLRDRFPGVPVAAARGRVDVALGDGTRFGPMEALPLPGHSADHVVLIASGVAMTGDAILGEGSVFVAPGPGSLAGYLAGLRRLAERRPELLAPGHGPPLHDPQASIQAYIAHRLERERRLLEALAAGARTVQEMLSAAWSDVPGPLRPAAAVTLAAHLDKLEEEGRLPEGVSRPELPDGFAPGP